MDTPILTVGMIVKNEEKVLARCLDSLQPLLRAVPSELIIVDTGSEDATVSIARKYTDQVLSYAWNDDFSAARNVSLDRARGLWYMFIDADEWFEDVSELTAFFQNRDELEKYNFGTYIVRNYWEDDGAFYKEFFLTRLCRVQPQVRFEGKIHETFNVSGPIKHFSSFVHHYGYAGKTGDVKVARNMPFLQKAVKDGGTPSAWYQLGREYIALKEFSKAEDAFQRGLAILTTSNRAVWCALYHDLANVYLLTRQFDALHKTVDVYMRKKVKPMSTDLDMALYNMNGYMGESNWEKSVEWGERYFSLLQEFRDGKLGQEDRISSEVIGYLEWAIADAHTTFAQSLYSLKDYQRALQEFALIKIEKSAENLQKNLLEEEVICCRETGQFSSVYPRYLELKDRNESAALEWMRVLLDDTFSDRSLDTVELLEEFAEKERMDVYGQLCRLRLLDRDGKTEFPLLEGMLADSAPISEPRYGELFYFAVKYGVTADAFVLRADVDSSNEFLDTASKWHDDFWDTLGNYYLGREFPENLCVLRWDVVTLEQVLLKSEILKPDSPLFTYFCKMTGQLTFRLFAKELLCEEQVQALPHGYRFGFFVHEAFRHKEKGDIPGYLNNLVNAGKAYPFLVRFVKELVEQEKKNLKNKQTVQNETALLMTQLKEKIQDMIFAGDLDNARMVLEQYAKLRPDDEDVQWLRMQLDNTVNTVS